MTKPIQLKSPTPFRLHKGTTTVGHSFCEWQRNCHFRIRTVAILHPVNKQWSQKQMKRKKKMKGGRIIKKKKNWHKSWWGQGKEMDENGQLILMKENDRKKKRKIVRLSGVASSIGTVIDVTVQMFSHCRVMALTNCFFFLSNKQ